MNDALLVAFFVLVYALAIVVPLYTAVIAVRGFDEPSVLEWYAERRRQRRRRLYTLARVPLR